MHIAAAGLPIQPRNVLPHLIPALPVGASSGAQRRPAGRAAWCRWLTFCIAALLCFGCKRESSAPNSGERESGDKATPQPVSSKYATPQPASRKYGDWESASFGGGGYLQNVVVCPSTPNRLYAYVDVGGLYRTDDGGISWRALHGGLPAGDGFYSVRGLMVDEGDPDRLLIALGNQWTANRGIYLSRDGGGTWDKKADAAFLGNEQHRSCGTITARLADGTLLVGSAGDGLLSSSDGGETWNLAGLKGFNIVDLKVSPDGTLYACALPHTMRDGRALAGGFFRKPNGGGWEELPQGPEEIVFAPDGALVGIFGSAEVRRSSDGGRTWEPFSQGLPSDPNDRGYTGESRFRALAAGPDFLLLGSSRGTIYRRNTGAAEWSRVRPDGVVEEVDGRPWWGRLQEKGWRHFGAAMGSLVIDPRNPSHWWFTDWYGIYETTDAGANWTLRINGIEVTVIHAITQDPADAGRVHAGMADNGYVTSMDGGRVYGGEKFTSNVKAVALDRSLPGRVYATGSRGGAWRAEQLWVSVDGGTEWVPSPMRGMPSVAERSINSLAVRPGHPYEVALASAGEVGKGGGVWRSLDGGRTFEAFNEGLEGAGDIFHREIWGKVAELAWGADGTMVAASHGTGRVFTRKPGEAWRAVSASLPGKPFQVRAQDGTFFMTRGPGGVWRSKDGEAWEQVLRDPAEILAVDASVPGRVAVATDGRVMLTDNGGDTWRGLGSPPMGLISALSFAGQRLLAGTRGGGFFLMSLGENDRDVRAGAAPAGLLPVAEESEFVMPAPAGNWTNPWKKSGILVAETAPGTKDVVLRSEGGPASGSTGLPFPATGQAFRVSGNWKVSGDGSVAKLAARAFDGAGAQIGWFPLAEIKADGKEHALDAQAELPAEARRGEIVLLFEGDGEVKLAALKFSRPDPLFGHPVAAENQTTKPQ